MGGIGLILGSSVYGPRGEPLIEDAAERGAVVLQRHHDGSYRLPHSIDHAANLRALIEAGCEGAIGVSSVGSLDKELIRQVIKRNINQIRYCYESQLTRNPKLSGKVSVKFVISASGSVAQSQVAQATTINAELETCVAGRVRTWVFPKPKGGGVVIVTYPFVFTQGG